jgi:hypothetical protein
MFYAIGEIGVKTQIAQKNLCHYFLPFLGYGF